MYSMLSAISKHLLSFSCDMVAIKVKLVHRIQNTSNKISFHPNRSFETTAIKMWSSSSEKLQTPVKNDTISSYLNSNISKHVTTHQNNVPNKVEIPQNEYTETIQVLNQLQSNTQNVALAKYRNPKDILPLFSRQLALAGITINDLNKINTIHISGTKGKGSTCAFVESIIRKSGLKTGFYNSPHLVKVTERIRINCLPIEDDKFCKYFYEVFNRLTIGTEQENITMPSYFSFLTILAFHIFIQEKVDCAIIEVGIGGEYDPTNIIQKPIVCGITSIHFDHMNILGDTIESIAWSKAGIAKPQVPIFTIEQEQEAALAVIKSRATDRNCPLHVCKSIKRDFELGIRGSIQYTNASLACQLAKYFLVAISGNQTLEKSPASADLYLETDLAKVPQFYKEALRTCSWPGRCQIVSCKQLVFFLDGAHTKESMENCISWFLTHSGQIEKEAIKILMVNIIGERNKPDILYPLAKRQDKFRSILFSTNRITPLRSDDTNPETYTRFQNDKSIENAQNNLNIWKSLLTNNIPETDERCLLISNTSDGVELVKNLATKESRKVHVLVTGSLHFVGALLETIPLVDC